MADRILAELPRGFRLIDVNTMAIASPVNQIRFVALSYMWQQGGDNHAQLEKQNLKELEAPNGLTGISIPSIVMDAISLCKELGERYLWVDRFCIVQNDSESKHDQIRGMDKIYRSSTFTIVAALNDRDGRGLPGCLNRPRLSSILTSDREFDMETRGLRPRNMQAIVNDSLWNRRGWTFQERVLSRRRLFITDNQAIFECTRGQAFEELAHRNQGRSQDYSTDSLVSPGSGLERVVAGREAREKEIPGFTQWIPYKSDTDLDYNIPDGSSLGNYLSWVQDYTSRQLSFSSDILNAFAGAGELLAQTFRTRMMFGHPERYLPQSLMWRCPGTVERRIHMPRIPSWSWASSLKQADFDWLNGRTSWTQNPDHPDHPENIASIVYFHYQDPDHGLRKLDVEERWIKKKMAIKDFETDPGIPTVIGLYTPSVSESTEIWRECPHNPWQTLAHQALDADACRVAVTMPGALVFNTTVASLRLDYGQRRPTEKGEGDGGCVAIRDGEEGTVGWLNDLGGPAWTGSHVGSKNMYEFIVISGSLRILGSGKRSEWSSDYGTYRLHAMLVERIGPHPYVVRRVEVGYLFTHCWKLCNPRWETIVLV